MPGAIEPLLWHYQNRSAEALAQHQAGVPVVGFTSNTVPWELIRAAGCFPLLLAPDLNELGGPTPLADAIMEPVFESKIRTICNGILSGRWNFLKLLIVARTSEPEYKLYLYLREAERQKFSAAIPPLWLYDLLHTRTPISRTYGLARTQELAERLKQIGSITAPSLAAAIAESNRARTALRHLQNLRAAGAPRISGSDALAISGALYFMGRAAHAKLVEAACREIKATKPLPGPRLLIKGTPLHHPKLHQALESQGAVVTAEDDWWGARAAGPNIPCARAGMPPCGKSLKITSSMHPAPGCGLPPPRINGSRQLSAVESTVWSSICRRTTMSIGWDYPRQRDFVAARGIPSFLIREDAGRGLSALTAAQIQHFIQSIRRGRHVSRT